MLTNSMRSGYGVYEPGGLTMLGETASGRLFVGLTMVYRIGDVIRREYNPAFGVEAAGERAGLNFKLLKRARIASVREVLRRTDVKYPLNESLVWYEVHGD